MSISLATKDFVQGGLIQDVDVLVKEAKFVVYDYDGKASVKEPPLALKLTLNIVDDDTEHIEYVTAGRSSDFIPTPEDDGETITSQGSAQALRKGSNLFLFNDSLEKCGFPQAKLVEGKASNYAGVKFHLIRPAAPKRTGLKDQSTTNEAGYEKSYLACGALISTPWDKSGQKGKSTPVTKTPATKTFTAATVTVPDAQEDDTDQELLGRAADLASTVLSDYIDVGKVTTAQFKMKLFSNLKGVPQDERNALSKVATSDDVLVPLGWTVKGSEIVLA